MVFQLPNTVLNLYRDIPIADGLQLVFPSDAERAGYFRARIHRTVESMTHINNSTGHITISGEARDALACNYLSFNNPAFEGKPFYARITNADQVNHNTVKIFFEIDWWQTFMFDVKALPSHIEREHLTLAQQQAALQNPYRGDIVELLTNEDLPVTPDLEVAYTRSDHKIVNNGLAEGSTNSKGLVHEPWGASPRPADSLVKQFGGTSYAGAGTDLYPTVMVLQLAHWDGWLDFIEEMTDPSKSSHVPNGQFLFSSLNVSNGFARGYYLLYFYGSKASGLQQMSDNMKTALDILTKNALTSQLLGIYQVPASLIAGDIHSTGTNLASFPSFPDYTGPADGTMTQDVVLTRYTDDVGYEPANPKLYRAPYRMIRAITPSGREHHFSFEDFGLSSFGVAATFKLYNNFDDTPSQTLAPVSYGGYSVDYKSRLVYDEFPMVGYNIDGYLSYLGAKYSEAVLSETGGQAHTRENYGTATAIGEGVQTAIKAAGQLGKLNATGALATINDGNIQNQTMRQLGGDNQASATAIREGSTAPNLFDHHRAATEADAYVAGNASGALGMRLGQDFWEIIKVTLKPEILKIYDDYFTMYGYKSDRLGVPRVLDWIAGGETPWFPATGTYCKTSNMKVYGVYAPAADSIADLFNSGCRFVKGS